MGEDCSSELEWLVKWYAAQCDGDWEHAHGIEIRTLDNPGWSVKIDLMETDLSDMQLDEVKIERSEKDWLIYEIRKAQFIGYCGAPNLHELLGAFSTVAKKRHTKSKGV